MLWIVARLGNGYVCCHFHIACFDDLVAFHLVTQFFREKCLYSCCVQMMISTDMPWGCKLFVRLFYLALAPAASLIVSSPFQLSQSKPCHRDTTTLAHIVLRALVCACDGSQELEWIRYDSCRSLFNSPGLVSDWTMRTTTSLFVSSLSRRSI